MPDENNIDQGFSTTRRQVYKHAAVHAGISLIDRIKSAIAMVESLRILLVVCCCVFLGAEAASISNPCGSGFYLTLDGDSCVGEFDACCACVTLVNVSYT